MSTQRNISSSLKVRNIVEQAAQEIISEESAERMIEMYCNKTLGNMYQLLCEIKIVECGKKHEASRFDPDMEMFDFIECKARARNAACGHCVFSPLGNQSKEADDNIGLGARMIMEDTILLLRSLGEEVNIPDALQIQIQDASHALDIIDIEAIDLYESLFKGRPLRTTGFELVKHDGHTKEKVAKNVNDAARPHGQPFLELRDIIAAFMEKRVAKIKKRK